MNATNAPVLHLLLSPGAAGECRQAMGQGDQLILVDAGVAAMLDREWLVDADTICTVRALAVDAAARGLTDLADRRQVALIADSEWVAMSFQAKHVLSWQ